MNSSKGKLMISVDKLMVILLFLFSLDIFDLSGALISLSIMLFIFFRFSTIKIDINCGLLILFSIFYFGSVAYYEDSSIENIIKFAIAPWGCYILGFNLYLNDEKKSVTRFAILLAAGFFLHGMLNLFYSIRMYGVGFNNNFRLAVDYWQNRQISVTTAALYYSPFVLMAIGALFYAKKNIIKILSVGVIVLALYATLIYQNRTLIMAAGFVLLIIVLSILKDSSLPTKKKLWVLGGIVLIIILIGIGWMRNMWGLRTFFEGTSLFSRLSEGQDRTKIWASFVFGDAWKYPFGGTKAILYNNKPYVHNLWLDVYRRAGILPFIFLLVFTIRGIKATRLFTYLRNDNMNENKGMLIALMIGIAILFFAEPIIEANPYIFYFPLLILGAICGSIRDRGLNKIENE